MNPLEEILTMIDPRFNAPGIEDPRRRLNQSQSGGGVAGPEATLGRLLPFLLGIQQQNLAGFNSQVRGGGMAQPTFDSAAPTGGFNAAPGAPQGQSIHPGGTNPGGNTLGLDGRTIQIPQGMGYGSQMNQGNGNRAAEGSPVVTSPRGNQGGGGRVRHNGGRR